MDSTLHLGQQPPQISAHESGFCEKPFLIAGSFQIRCKSQKAAGNRDSENEVICQQLVVTGVNGTAGENYFMGDLVHASPASTNATGMLVLQLVMVEIGSPSHPFSSCKYLSIHPVVSILSIYLSIFSNLYLNSCTQSPGSCQ